MTYRLLLLFVWILSSGLLASAQNLYFPPKTGVAWQTINPTTLHFCPDRIDSLYRFLESRHTKSFLLLKDGKIVLEKYFGTFTQDSVWYWASAGKSLTAFLVGQAQEEGLVDIHRKTSDYLGAGWTSAPPDKEALITPWHQLTMTSGLDDTFTPTPTEPDPNTCTDPECLNYLVDAGTRWAYHTGAYRLLQDVMAGASGQTINQFTKAHVLDRTGMKGLWFEDVFYSRPRDMARFGLLALARGVWAGDTLLHDQAYFQAMTHPSQPFNKSYGYLWWLNGQSSFMVPGLQLVIPGKMIPNAPDDMYAALGKNDQKIHVVPSKGWVVVRMGDAAGYTNNFGDAVPILFDNAMWEYLNQLECNATAVTEVENMACTVSPNPSAGSWQVHSNQPIERVECYDACGKLIFAAGSIDATDYLLSPGDVPPGMYYVKVLSRGASWGTKLIRI